MVDGLPTKALPMFASMLHFEAKTRAKGYRFGQKVYVRFRGRGDYMSNFMSAYIFSVSNQYARIMSRDGRCTLTYATSVLKTGKVIYTVDEFVELRDAMLAKNKLTDPDVERSIKKLLRAEEEYELKLSYDTGSIPTIDSVFKDSGIPKASKRRNKTASDSETFVPIASLVDMINDFSNGYIREDNESTYKPKKKSRKKSSGGDVIVKV
jgi:hypothetical protein